MAVSRTFTTRLGVDGDGGTRMSAISVPFDPKEVFGKVRAPVLVGLNGYTFRSTIFRMCGDTFVPLRQSHQDGAGVKPGQRVEVTLTADDKPREVGLPKDMKAALKKAGVLDRFEAMSFTHRREYVEAYTGAKKPETRDRRLKACIAAVKLRKPAAVRTTKK
ncbi:MAG: YdeI/OmpD-associated family protein [Phycisphaerales bacterium]